ncbi:homeobox protein knotted-1-like 8 [Lingula anatina]|uniref:Homeobox protein knotted-1-like 8 n=1 Tax=Lingula anatina TaxID=7574 RepID=A0A2R2MRS1_LINAN|nr:homeobox protein knotted-1-like 8 [Lingula anatina]|eukprot:XP_023932951.1 homeobox protein knotted-1-like 8 [Lingula anatina]
MASLVDQATRHQSTGLQVRDGKLLQLSAHPMFSELQATLATQCQQAAVPYSLVSPEKMSSGQQEGQATPVLEAVLHSEFRKLSSLQNEKVAQLESFFNTQCAVIETQRSDAIADLAGTMDRSSFEHQLKLIHKFHDQQRVHLTLRVSASLNLLKDSLPEDPELCTTKKTKNRLLNPKAVEIMQNWYDMHCENPYPTEEEKRDLAEQGGISLGQVKAWFANKRNRNCNTKPKHHRRKAAEDFPKIYSRQNSTEVNTSSKPCDRKVLNAWENNISDHKNFDNNRSHKIHSDFSQQEYNDMIKELGELVQTTTTISQKDLILTSDFDF